MSTNLCTRTSASICEATYHLLRLLLHMTYAKTAVFDFLNSTARLLYGRSSTTGASGSLPGGIQVPKAQEKDNTYHGADHYQLWHDGQQES